MTTPPDLLDAYLDGVLPPDQHAAFERRLQQSPDLLAQAALQRDIDGSIARLFPAPQPLVIGAPARSHTRLFAALALLAATLAIAAVGLWQVGLFSPAPAPYYAATYPSQPGALYSEVIARGFSPSWVCETDEQFIDAVQSAFGQPALVREAPGLEVVGWLYGTPVLSPATYTLLTRVDGREVLVLFDSAKRDRPITAPAPPAPGAAADPQLNIFRRQLDRLILYEITPLDAPRVLPHIYTPAG